MPLDDTKRDLNASRVSYQNKWRRATIVAKTAEQLRTYGKLNVSKLSLTACLATNKTVGESARRTAG